MTRETNQVQNFMPLWIADYYRDTQHLTRGEHGAYLLILFAYWVNGGPLKDDDKRMAAIARATRAEWKAMRPTMAEFFHVEAELQKAREMKAAHGA
jgi:uncharacterized protein YdaU (DUF1376 family)